MSRQVCPGFLAHQVQLQCWGPRALCGRINAAINEGVQPTQCWSKTWTLWRLQIDKKCVCRDLGMPMDVLRRSWCHLWESLLMYDDRRILSLWLCRYNEVVTSDNRLNPCWRFCSSSKWLYVSERSQALCPLPSRAPSEKEAWHLYSFPAVWQMYGDVIHCMPTLILCFMFVMMPPST